MDVQSLLAIRFLEKYWLHIIFTKGFNKTTIQIWKEFLIYKTYDDWRKTKYP